MPAQEQAFLTQRAVVWEPRGVDRYGQVRVTDLPYEIGVRWSDVQREATDPEGNTLILDATAVASRRVPVGSRIWLGALEDLPGTGFAAEPNSLMYVRLYNGTPDLKGREVCHSLGLMRYKDALQELKTGQ